MNRSLRETRAGMPDTVTTHAYNKIRQDSLMTAYQELGTSEKIRVMSSAKDIEGAVSGLGAKGALEVISALGIFVNDNPDVLIATLKR